MMREMEANLRAEANRTAAAQSQQIKAMMAPVENLLDKVTGQQMWIRAGGLDNAFILLYLPFLNQKEEPVPARIAIESARKGSKMDEHHCIIAVQVETQGLGEVGVDALFDNDTLTFRVLTHDLDFMPQLIEEIYPETKDKFAKLGFALRSIETGSLTDNIEFQNFLKGKRRSGVDVRG